MWVDRESWFLWRVRRCCQPTSEEAHGPDRRTAPADAPHWSTRGLAACHGISHQTVAEIWKAFGLKPGDEDSLEVSPDPQLVEKIRDIVALYLNPPVAVMVFAVDEKPQIQALGPTAPTRPMLSTTPVGATHDYVRSGTVDLFAALDIATGTVITDLRKTHTSADFVAFLNKVNRNVPDDLSRGCGAIRKPGGNGHARVRSLQRRETAC